MVLYNEVAAGIFMLENKAPCYDSVHMYLQFLFVCLFFLFFFSIKGCVMRGVPLCWFVNDLLECDSKLFSLIVHYTNCLYNFTKPIVYTWQYPKILNGNVRTYSCLMMPSDAKRFAF